MRWLGAGLLILGALLLQNTAFSLLLFLGVKPDLVLLAVVAWALARGAKEGALLGGAAGLLLDLLRGHWVGLGAVTYLTTGYVVGLLEDRLFKENLLVPVVVSFFATFLDQLLFLLLGNSFGLGYPLFFTLWRITFPSMLYNAALAPLVYRQVQRLEERINQGVWEKGGSAL
ncbi:MAG: rod shape-determining protein MreD [Bacillota bacterium]|nr:rod shape-determining protein MreD [Bacillota bacterium]